MTIRPIEARARAAAMNEDKANADDLLSDIKERAEHLMLLDLGAMMLAGSQSRAVFV